MRYESFFMAQEVILMKKIFLGIGLILTLSFLFCVKGFALTNEEAASLLKEMVRAEFKILATREAPIGGFWEVILEVGQEKRVFYVDKSLRYIFLGELLDRQTKRNLTYERVKEFRKVNVSSLSLENAIPEGKGKRKVYIFTDPQCHFCAELHAELKQRSDLQAYLFLYPINPVSYEKAKSIWCSQDRLKALEDAYSGKELPLPACNTSAIDRNVEWGRRNMIDSTPTLIFENGKIIEGYTPGTLENLFKSAGGF
jgi:thiol:disulfide interchange protein DsbC